MISVAEAERMVLAELPLVDSESCPLSSAGGRVLREKIADARPAPPFDRVTMDGIALAFEQWDQGRRRFPLLGIHPAGAPAPQLSDPAGCLEVMTGACLPRGCDTVIQVEQCLFDETGHVNISAADDQVTPGQCIHRVGEDYPAGAILLHPGRWIGPRELAVIASAGRTSVAVSALPRIAVCSSGDELVEPGEPLQNFQIFRSNAYALQAGLFHHGSVTLFHAADSEIAVTAMVEKTLATNDVIIISGGASKGRFDYIHTTLAAIGARKIFHGVAQRPGKPMWFGHGMGGQPIFALPGNPLSTLVCLHRYVLPALGRMAAMDPAPALSARLSAPISFPPPLTWLLPVKIHLSNTAVVEAEPLPPNTSGDYTSVLWTTGFLELPANETRFAAGSVMRFFPWINLYHG